MVTISPDIIQTHTTCVILLKHLNLIGMMEIYLSLNSVVMEM